MRVPAWLAMAAPALAASACSRLVGIEDYSLRDDAAPLDAEVGDAPVDVPYDAPPFGSALSYLKASNTGASDQFGVQLALSADGSTLAVGAPLEDSSATGVNGIEASEAAADAGAVYVFVRGATGWTQQAYIKASNTGANDRFGSSLALSADGSTLAVGAPLEDSAALGIGGDQASNARANSGATYVFVRDAGTWSQQVYLKASNAGGTDEFGRAVALSGDGNTLAVGAPVEASLAIGINGDQTDNTAAAAGAAYVFVRAGTTWVQQAYVKATNTEADDRFGTSLALSATGDTLAVGAPLEDSTATAINGNQSSNLAPDAGAAYVLKRISGIWSHQAYVKATNTGASDQFANRLALAGDGNTLAVGAALEDSSATGIGGANNNTAGAAGAVYVYAQLADTWTPQAYVKASNTGAGDQFGASLALGDSGDRLVVGAPLEDSAAAGLDGDQASELALGAGALYVFERTAAMWTQLHYIKATNPQASDNFGSAVAVGGAAIAGAAPLEDSAATGIGGDQTDNSALGAGAVYVIE